MHPFYRKPWTALTVGGILATRLAAEPLEAQANPPTAAPDIRMNTVGFLPAQEKHAAIAGSSIATF